MQATTLEQAIARNPDDEGPWQVYADWLTEHGDPLGAVIASACAGRADSGEQRALEESWFLQLDGVRVSWRFGTVDRLALFPDAPPSEAGTTMEAALERFLANPRGRLVRHLEIGLPPREPGDIDWHFDGVFAAIADAGPLPFLTRMDLTRTAGHMDQDSWRRIGDLSRLWAAAPRLRSLAMRGAVGSDGGPALVLGDMVAPNLERLVIQSGGLSPEAPRAVGRATLPALRHLELWFGRDDYGNDCTVADLDGILAGTGLPALTTLGLCNSEWETPLIDAIARSALLPRLRRLDLSKGVLFDEGAAALLTHAARFAHLESIDVGDNYLSEAHCAELQRALPRIALGVQRDPEDGYRFASVGE